MSSLQTTREFNKRIAEILDGWRNYYWKTGEVEEIAHKRLEVCAQCEHAKFISITRITALVKKGRYLGCELCRCPISKKTRSLKSKCPKGYWNE